MERGLMCPEAVVQGEDRRDSVRWREGAEEMVGKVWKAYQQVLLEPGSSPRAVLPSHSEIASMQAVETQTCGVSGGIGGGEVEGYHAWLVTQAKRYILSQTGFELDGADCFVACQQFEDVHMQQGRFGDWGGIKRRARGLSCSGDAKTIECSSWWSQYGAGAPELQRCALRVVHMWSCASPAKRNWAIHEGIHTKKRNQLTFKKVVQLVEISANVRLNDYRRAGCSYVLPWQRDEGMLDCQAGLEVESVHTGTRRGMTQEEIAQQVTLITCDPIGTFAPPSADAVFDRRACIFRPYPRDDDSDEEPAPEAADDPALPIPPEIDETHEDADDMETRTYTACRAVDRAEREMTGRDEDCWGPFGEVVYTESSMPTPPVPSHAPPSPVSPLQSATAAAETEELASSLPQHELLQRFVAVLRLRLRSPSLRVLQEEVGHLATPADEGATPSGGGGQGRGSDGGGGSSSGGGGTSSGDGGGGGASWSSGEGGDSNCSGGERGGSASDVVERDVCDTTLFGRTDIDLDSTRSVTKLTARLRPGLGTHSSGGTRTTGARELAAAGCEPQRGRGGGVSTSSLDHALRAVTRVVHEQTPCKRVVPRPRPVPAEGGPALGESSGVEGVGMPCGSCRQDTVAQASTRVVLVRKGDGPFTIEEDDPKTAPTVQEEDEDYEGEEESEEEDSESGNSGDHNDDDEPPPPPPTRASRRSAAQTSSSAQGKRRPTSGAQGGTRRQSGKGKRGRWSSCQHSAFPYLHTTSSYSALLVLGRAVLS
ncbi:hypothetical protein CBR_g881 [Chara braunii]|uniref:HAT C-terminal dimerisation domain-containing protein n=1 Tax=Chara braunii TaxID=69332 RepID=A0A388KCH3_CHABU|nr:hypothetical protein CBR_g881 [Chara braunii]|eukprot:GBG67755.1 hypothetical protein CBR_g881 [Chara braunii]